MGEASYLEAVFCLLGLGVLGLSANVFGILCTPAGNLRKSAQPIFMGTITGGGVDGFGSRARSPGMGFGKNGWKFLGNLGPRLHIWGRRLFDTLKKPF